MHGKKCKESAPDPSWKLWSRWVDCKRFVFSFLILGQDRTLGCSRLADIWHCFQLVLLSVFALHLFSGQKETGYLPVNIVYKYRLSSKFIPTNQVRVTFWGKSLFLTFHGSLILSLSSSIKFKTPQCGGRHIRQWSHLFRFFSHRSVVKLLIPSIYLL